MSDVQNVNQLLFLRYPVNRPVEMGLSSIEQVPEPWIFRRGVILTRYAMAGFEVRKEVVNVAAVSALCTTAAAGPLTVRITGRFVFLSCFMNSPEPFELLLRCHERQRHLAVSQTTPASHPMNA